LERPSDTLYDHVEKKEVNEMQLRQAISLARVGFFDWDVPENHIVFNGQMQAY